MADKGKGINVVVGGHRIDNVATKVGQAVEKVSGGKVDAEKIGKKIDKSKNLELDLDKLKGKK